MRNPIRLLMLTAVLLASFVLTQAAPSHQERFGTLTSLTTYFPANSVLYSSIRTDLDYLLQLNGVYERVISQLGADDLPENLDALLSLATQDTLGGTFGDTVAPWLGESMAIGAYPLEGELGTRIVLQITDEDAALNAVIQLYEVGQGWSRRDLNDYTVFAAPLFDQRLAVYDDVLVFSDNGPEPQQIPTLAPDITTNSYYQDALDRLPDNPYNLIGFVDVPLYAALNDLDSLEGALGVLFYRVVGALSFGGYLLDDQTLALDMVQRLGNDTGLQALGINLPGEGATLSTELLERIPSDALAVVQGADLAAQLEVIGTSVAGVSESLGPAYNSLLLTLVNQPGSAQSVGILGALTTAVPEVVFANLSGFDYETEIRPLLTEDWAAVVSLNPVYDPASTQPLKQQLFQVAALIEMPDPQAAQDFLQKLRRELTISLYSLDEGQPIVITDQDLPGEAQGLRIAQYQDVGAGRAITAEWVIATDGAVLAIGAPTLVTRMIAGEGGGFVMNENWLVSESGLAAYVNPDAASLLLRYTGNFTGDLDPAIEPLLVLYQVAQSASIIIGGNADHDLRVRLSFGLK
jgi:hypothetical protein